jgi:uncharacterized protein
MPTLEQARAWYAQADPVHDFEHVLRVYRLAEELARLEGADLEIVHAAALLHDAEGSHPAGSGRKSHHLESAAFAEQVLRAEGWDAQRIAAVQHCIRAHRYRGDGELPETLEARVLFDADKLDVLGAIGVARVIAYAAIRGTPFYAPPSERFLQGGEKEPGEPHSAYHEYLFKLRKVKARMFTARARQMAEERERFLGKFFEQLIEEINGRA